MTLSMLLLNKICSVVQIFMLLHGCSPVNLLQIFRTLFRRNTSRRLVLSRQRYTKWSRASTKLCLKLCFSKLQKLTLICVTKKEFRDVSTLPSYTWSPCYLQINPPSWTFLHSSPLENFVCILFPLRCPKIDETDSFLYALHCKNW